MPTVPKHTKTNYFLRSGLFDNLESFSDLEKRISELPTEKERGDAFEVFAEAYLATQTIMQAKEVWPFDKIPATVKRKFRLDTKKDMGVDGLLQTTADEYHAYQVKFRSGRPSLTWAELSTFIGLSDKTDQKLVFTNCNRIPDVVEKREDVFCIRGTDLGRLTPEDFDYILGWLKKKEKPKPKKEPRDYQQEALDAIHEGLTNGRRATAVMACGTGKTLLALWVAQRLGYKKILVLVPSLALLSQTLHEWMQDTSWDDFSYICVCSDPTVTKRCALGRKVSGTHRLQAKKYGDCNVPRHHTNTALSRWVNTQRAFKRRNMLSQERITKLERIVFEWEPTQARWNEMYQGLVDYKKTRDHCNVPQDYPENPRLGRWAGFQRTLYKKGKLSQDRIDKLEAIGFEWEPRRRG